MNMEEKLYTIADIEALPEGERAELIDGKMYMMATPAASHQLILNFINNEIYNYIKRKGGDCKLFISPYSVYLNETDTYVEPDLVVVCDKSKLDEKGCHGAPDFAVEVVSPSSRRMDCAIKLFKFRTYGVREYWIVDPGKRQIQVYDLEKDNMKEYSFSDKVPVGIYNGDLVIDFSEYE